MMSASQLLAAPPSPLGSLAIIPLEVRRMIYGLVLASSSSLIGTSKAIKEETLPMLYEYGNQRIQIRYDRTIVYGFCASYFDPRNWKKSYTSVEYPGWRLFEKQQALVRNTSITVDMVKPHVLDRGPDVCIPRFSSILRTFTLTCASIKWSPTFAKTISDLVNPKQAKQHCHITFILGSFCELYPHNEPGFLDSLAPLQAFESVTVELKKRPWGYDRYPASFGTTEKAEDEEGVNAVAWLKWTFGCNVKGWCETGKKVKIVRSFLDVGRKREVLWDSDMGDEEEVDRTREDVVMGED